MNLWSLVLMLPVLFALVCDLRTRRFRIGFRWVLSRGPVWRRLPAFTRSLGLA